MNKLIVGKKKKNKKISLFCKILTSSLPSGNIHLIYNYWESYQQMTFKYTTKPQGCTSSKLAVNILIYVSEKSKAFFILTDDSSLQELFGRENERSPWTSTQLDKVLTALTNFQRHDVSKKPQEYGAQPYDFVAMYLSNYNSKSNQNSSK